jgi:hypothetical protein
MSSNMRSDGVPPAYKRRGCLGGHFFVVLCCACQRVPVAAVAMGNVREKRTK